MIGTAMTVLESVAIIASGPILHELTHAAVARALGGSVIDIDLFDLYVDFEAPSAFRERLVLLAPGVIGLLLTPLVWVAWNALPLVFAGAVVIAWLLYCFNGGTHGELSILQTEPAR